jgi:hypothetical protein
MLCLMRSMSASQGARSSVTPAVATAVRGRMLGVGQTNQHHSFALACFLARSSTAGRTSTRSTRSLVNHVCVTSRTPPAGTTKRTFFGSSSSSYGHYRNHHIPEPEEFVTPMESILMDCTAWFVAFALIYTPSTLNHHHDDTEDEADNNNKSHGKEQAHRERRRRQERNESRGTNRQHQHQKDDSVDN